MKVHMLNAACVWPEGKEFLRSVSNSTFTFSSPNAVKGREVLRQYFRECVITAPTAKIHVRRIIMVQKCFFLWFHRIPSDNISMKIKLKLNFLESQ